MNMDLPLHITAARLPISEHLIKLEPSSQLSELDNVEEGVQQEHLYPYIVQKLAHSLSPRSPSPSPLTSIQPTKRKQKGKNMANSSSRAQTEERTALQTTEGGPAQLHIIAESAGMVQPATVEVYTSQHGNDMSNLPPSSTVEKDTSHGAPNEPVIQQPTTVEAFLSHDVDQSALNLSGNVVVCTTDRETEKESTREREEGEKERKNEQVNAITSFAGDQPADSAFHSVSVSYQVDIEGDGDNDTLDSSQNLSQPPGPPNWTDSQQRGLDSDAFYSSDSQPPSLKIIRLESPSPTPESPQPLSQLIAQTDTQSPQQQDSVCHHTTQGSPLSPLVVQMDTQLPRRQQDPESPLSSLLVAQTDTQLPRRQDPEPSHATGESTLSPLVAQMRAPSTSRQDPDDQSITKSSSVVAQTDMQSQEQQRGFEDHHSVEQSPLSQLIAQMDAQPPQGGPESQNVTEDNHCMECSRSEDFLCDPPLDNGEGEEERVLEGERGRIRENEVGRGGRKGGERVMEPPVVGREGEESQGGVNGADDNGGDGRVSHEGLASHSIFGGFKQKVQGGWWIKEASGGRGERLRSQRSPLTEGQSSKSVSHAAEQPSTSSGQRSSDDRALRDQHLGGEDLGDGEHGTLEVDVVGMGSQPPATLEVDVEGTCSVADEMETTGAPPGPSRDAIQQTQVQQSASVEDTAHKVIESSRDRVEERPRVKVKTKKMSLTIDKSKKAVQKKDATGNITMETPRHSQPPFQLKQKSPELYSQEYLHSSTSNAPLGGSASSSRSNVGTTTSIPLSKSTGSTTSSAGPSTSKAFTAQGAIPNSNTSTTKSPAILSSYDIKSQEPSDPSIKSNKSLYTCKSGRDLFASSNPSSNSAAPSNLNNGEVVFTQSSRTRTNAPHSSSGPGKTTKLRSEKGATFTTQPSHQSIPVHSTTTPSLSSPSVSPSPPPDRNHSRSTTPSSSVRQISPDFEPYVRVVDPVYHDDPQLERWRQLMQAHWFEVKMVKSRQPLTMAEKRSLKQFGLLDDHNQ